MAENGQCEMSAGLEEPFLKEEGQEESLEQELSDENTDEIDNDMMSAVKTPNDVFSVINGVISVIFSRYLSR